MTKKKPASAGNAKQVSRQNHGRGTTIVPQAPKKPQGRWVMVMDGRGRRRMVQERPGS